MKESDLTAAFEREMDELASVVEELEDTLDVQVVEDLRELSESMYEGLVTTRETHAKLREKTRKRGLPLLTQLSARDRSMRHLLQSHRFWSGVDERLCPFTQKAEIEVLDDALSRTFQICSW